MSEGVGMVTVNVTMITDEQLNEVIMKMPGVASWVEGVTNQVSGQAAARAGPGAGGASSEYGASISAGVRRVGSFQRPIGYVHAADPHALLVEFGTAARHTLSGADRGHMPAKHVLQGAALAAGLTLDVPADPRVVADVRLIVQGL